MQQKTKVCYCITKGNWGGAQRYVYSLATSLSKDKYDVFAIVGDGNTLKRKLEEKGVRVYELNSLKRNISVISEIKSSFNMLKIIQNEKPDVLHLNSPKAAGFGCVAGKLCDTSKIIQTIHGWSFNETRGIIAVTFIRFFSWLTVMLCHKTIVIAEKEKEQVLKMPFVNKDKIVLIKNGLEKIEFRDRESAQKDLLFRMGKIDVGDVLWLGTISELHKNKGLRYAILALENLHKPFIFIVIGEGEEREGLEKLIREKHLENKIFLVGFMENANQYLKAFDIFTLTSTKEGLPYSILEAGLAELPVVASSVGGIPEIIEGGINGVLVEKGNPAKITQAIDYLINIKDQRKILGGKLREKVEKDFSVEQMLEKTLRLYS